ncbi:acyltransferase family protein [Hymenobacter sp. BT491]|uniref:acyltransferase family protein n=1 Tax=Hymenobacter sp. BT491 TaxID=2766779 RepID=UPI001653C7BA|nr:acyltransferase [Hymenobacter sp. BT491]MBC6988556.1 acyltransferase [Hymenobacter sp. BT491]
MRLQETAILTPAKNKEHYPALTGLRAVAALMVVFFHMGTSGGLDTKGFSSLAKHGLELVRQWHLGVVVFFVLSGFLIATRYAQKIELTGPWLRRYFQNRFARIYPIYFLLTAFAFGMMWLRPRHAWYEWPDYYNTTDQIRVFLLNLTLTRSFFVDLGTMGLPTAWTLTVEECFYLSAPLLLLGLKRNLRLIILYPVLFLLLGLGLVAVCSRFVPVYGLMGANWFMLTSTFFGRSTEFILGMGLALWMARHPVQRSSRGLYTWIGCLGILSVLVGLAIFNHYHPVSGTPEWSTGQILVNNVVAPLFVCALLRGLVTETTAFSRVLSTKTADLLGKSSYILYLLHLGTFDTLFRQHVSNNNLVCLVAYLLISIVLYKTIEHPLNLRLRAKPAAPKQAVAV